MIKIETIRKNFNFGYDKSDNYYENALFVIFIYE